MKNVWIKISSLILTVLLMPLALAAQSINPSAATALTKNSDLTSPIVVTQATPKVTCLGCHGVKGFAIPTGETGDSDKRHLFVNGKVLSKSIHGDVKCVACHRDIHQIPHNMKAKHTVSCVTCHQKEVAEQKSAQGKSSKEANLKLAIHENTLYLGSIHAMKNKLDPSKPNATCWDCHGKHDMFRTTKADSSINRLLIPQTCGRCHQKELKEYENSVHGVAVVRYGDTKAAVCSDCHTAHQVGPPGANKVKMTIVRNCGTCHKEQLKTYMNTYHGQVLSLGYPYVAKCYDCHGSHGILKVNNPHSRVFGDNKVQVCQQCHKNANAEFAKFKPHADASDYKSFPALWIISHFMDLLILGVFAFFWTHTILWFIREYKERKLRKARIRVDESGNPISNAKMDEEKAEKEVYVRRFTWVWRLVHLVLAVDVMILVITGTTLLYADSIWASFVMKMLGGPRIEGIIHRTCAVVFATLFIGHLVALFYKLVIKTKKFRWFGPESLLPRWQDFKDIWNMFKWFLGKGPRPSFDRWAYWEKFDYWAPFWGMFIIGLSGATLWMHNSLSAYIPGWAYNIATLIHGDEAFLAVVFLFTVHYFNCHFRPDKFPQDIVMFTGCMPLEEFKKDHKLEYERLVKDGTLKNYLVKPPSKIMVRFSKILGFVLIVVGLLLLTLVLIGFITKL